MLWHEECAHGSFKRASGGDRGKCCFLSERSVNSELGNNNVSFPDKCSLLMIPHLIKTWLYLWRRSRKSFWAPPWSQGLRWHLCGAEGRDGAHTLPLCWEDGASTRPSFLSNSHREFPRLRVESLQNPVGYLHTAASQHLE